MATHSSILAWRIPGTEEPGGLPSVGSHRVGHDLAAAAGNTEQIRSCQGEVNREWVDSSAFSLNKLDNNKKETTLFYTEWGNRRCWVGACFTPWEREEGRRASQEGGGLPRCLRPLLWVSPRPVFPSQALGSRPSPRWERRPAIPAPGGM